MLFASTTAGCFGTYDRWRRVGKRMISQRQLYLCLYCGGTAIVTRSYHLSGLALI